jgi:AcrR family transcriptional regulator
MNMETEESLRKLVSQGYLSVSEIAKEADVSRPTIYRWLKCLEVKPATRRAILRSSSEFARSLSDNYMRLDFREARPNCDQSEFLIDIEDREKPTVNDSLMTRAGVNESCDHRRNRLVEDRLHSLIKASKRLKDLLQSEVDIYRDQPSCHVGFERNLEILRYDAKANNLALDELSKKN